MASVLTFAQAKTRLASQITYNGTVDEAIQEAVDRAYEMGRWRGMIVEVPLVTGDYLVNTDPDEVYYDMDLSIYNGAVGFRSESQGYPIMDQAMLYRDGVNGGDKSFIDKGEVDVSGTIKHRYRCPLWLQTAPDFVIYVLAKKISPTLTDSDTVPIKSFGALKQAVIAVCYENVNDESRAQICWQKFIEFMEREQRQFEGPHQRHIGVSRSLRRKPTGRM